MKQHPGLIIRRTRRAIEMTMTELGHCIGRSKGYMSRFERGRIASSPSEIAQMKSAMTAHRRAVRGGA